MEGCCHFEWAWVVAVGCVVGCWLLVVGCWLLVVVFGRFVVVEAWLRGADGA